MPKYYVDSGNLRCVCDALDEMNAVQRALSRCPETTMLGMVIRVNEQGFDEPHEDDLYIATLPFLEELDIE